MTPGFDYDEAELDVLDNGGDPDYLEGNPEKRDKYLRGLGLDPEDYGGGGSHGNKSGSHDDGCYLTTAGVRARGLADDCWELNTLRRFRDGYLRKIPDGESEIAAYYEIAPKIVKAVNEREDAQSVWNGVYEEMIAPCLALIGENRQEEAYRLYKAESLKLAEKVL